MKVASGVELCVGAPHVFRRRRQTLDDSRITHVYLCGRVNCITEVIQRKIGALTMSKAPRERIQSKSPVSQRFDDCFVVVLIVVVVFGFGNPLTLTSFPLLPKIKLDLILPS